MIFRAIDAVERDLTRRLISMVRDAFRTNQSTYDIEDALREVVSPSLAKDVANAYDNVCRRIPNFSEKGEFLCRKVREDDSHAKLTLEHDEKYFRLLYHTMRQAITARAEFLMQGQVKEFEEAFNSFVREQLHELRNVLRQANLDASEIQETAISELKRKLAEKAVELPQDLFNLNATVERTESSECEVTGQEEYNETVTKTRQEKRVEYYEEGSCFFSQTKQRTVNVPVKYTETQRKIRDTYGQVIYIELLLPTPQLMGQQWSEGITKAKNNLWDILRDWILEGLNEARQIFEDTIEDITRLADRTLEDQFRVIETNFEEEKQFWLSFESSHNEAKKAYKHLKDLIRLNR